MAMCDETDRFVDVPGHRIRAVTPDDAISEMEAWVLAQIEADMTANKYSCGGDCDGGSECGLMIVTDVDKLIGNPKLGRDKKGNKCYIASIVATKFQYKCVCAHNDEK